MTQIVRGTILVTKDLKQIVADAPNAWTRGLSEGEEFTVEYVDLDYDGGLITLNDETLYTLEPDEDGFSYATFFTIKGE